MVQFERLLHLYKKTLKKYYRIKYEDNDKGDSYRQKLEKMEKHLNNFSQFNKNTRQNFKDKYFLKHDDIDSDNNNTIIPIPLQIMNSYIQPIYQQQLYQSLFQPQYKPIQPQYNPLQPEPQYKPIQPQPIQPEPQYNPIQPQPIQPQYNPLQPEPQYKPIQPQPIQPEPQYNPIQPQPQYNPIQPQPIQPQYNPIQPQPIQPQPIQPQPIKPQPIQPQPIQPPQPSKLDKIYNKYKIYLRPHVTIQEMANMNMQQLNFIRKLQKRGEPHISLIHTSNMKPLNENYINSSSFIAKLKLALITQKHNYFQLVKSEISKYRYNTKKCYTLSNPILKNIQINLQKYTKKQRNDLPHICVDKDIKGFTTFLQGTNWKLVLVLMNMNDKDDYDAYTVPLEKPLTPNNTITNKNVGIQNGGNTCFSNAAIQLLFNMTDFVSKLVSVNIDSLKNDFKTNGVYLYALQQIFKVMLKTNNYISYDSIKDYVDLVHCRLQNNGLKDINPIANFRLNKRIQQDADDAMNSYLEYFSNPSNLLSDIKNLLKITMNEKIGCDQYQVNMNIKEQSTDYTKLQLEIKDNSIQKCINKSIEREYFDFANKQSKCIDNGWKDIALKPSRYLIISLKRFNPDMTKNNQIVHPNDIIQVDNTSYQLKGYIYHTGNNPDSGHYVYYKKVNNSWTLLDDITIDNNNDTIYNGVKSMEYGYIYLYEKVLN